MKALLFLSTLIIFGCSKNEVSQIQTCVVQPANYGADIVCSNGSVTPIYNGSNGQDGGNCSVEQLPNGSKVSCTDGTFAIIYDGKDGGNCSATGNAAGAQITCDDGSIADISNGLTGENCTVEQLTNGTKIACGVNIAYIYNGLDAPTTAYTVTEVIDPCGPSLSGFNEVLLRMSGGQVLAHYAQGNLQFLTVLNPGTFITTDSQACQFTLHNDGNITW